MAIDLCSRWYVAQTHPHAETKASLHLQRQGFGIYLPRYLKQRRHARRVDTIAAPLFPRYLFISLDSVNDNWMPIRSTRGVGKIVRFNEHPLPVDDRIIDEIRRRLRDQGR